MNTRTNLCMVVASVVALCIFVYWRTTQARLSASELASFYDRLQLGMTRQEANRIYASCSFRKLKVRDVSDETMIVLTPVEWGAANWVLWAELSSNRITAIRIRYHDSQAVKPPNAPADKVANVIHTAPIP